MGTRYEIDDPERLDEHGSRIVTELDSIEVAVFNVHDDYYAVPNYCPHVGGPLGEGTLTGQEQVTDDRDIDYDTTEKIVECPWHCWRFDVTTGRNIDDRRFGIPTFDVERGGDSLYVVL